MTFYRRGKKAVRTMVLSAGLVLMATAAVAAGAPKYVFYFIGDGMGPAQRQSAQYFYKMETKNPDARLLMNSLDTSALVTTHSDNTLVTDSAAGGTALATGFKTTNGLVGKLPDGTNVKTIAEAARDAGYAVGLATTTRITHATPASFSAHNMSRGNENEIAVDQLNANFDYLAGGGFRHFVAKGNADGLKSKRKDGRDLVAEFQTKGYTTFIGDKARDAFRAYEPKKGEKVLAPLSYSALGMEIDRRFSTQKENAMPALSELTAKGIETLTAQEKPFFLMVEGGRIDYAAHCNDAAGTIYDTLALDAALAEAYAFYKKHPEETLIVVAADHETGGMAMGISLDSKGYFLKLDELFKVKASVEDVLTYVYPQMITDYPEVASRQKAYLAYVADNFGLTDLNARELKKLKAAMAVEDRNQTLKAEQQTTYGYAYTPTMIAVAHLVSERARISWTSYVHTSSVIALSAVGYQAEQFDGFRDNTDIPRIMAGIMGVKLSSFDAVPSKALLGKTVGPNEKYSKIPYGHTENVAGKN
ncbi:alkaline phosphatase [Desulfoluna spongiiphila]|uniref:alkaline phosphatase n=1 Tax=Desulfoluna spongiiphila TaxID=419481 RepID=UPI0012591E4B|nr:alkaline phosphatase [Desulfoluna spongiiphila]VVS91725.1 alkaline phosphatase [Desulfoluna spongiiphila]